MFNTKVMTALLALLAVPYCFADDSAKAGERRSLCPRAIDCTLDCRPVHRNLCAAGRAGRTRHSWSRAPGQVVLFIHGAGTPAEVSFDVPYQDYSWMAYLARAGFNTFSDGYDRLRALHAARGS